MKHISLEEIEINAKLFNKFTLAFEEFGKALISYGKIINTIYIMKSKRTLKGNRNLRIPKNKFMPKYFDTLYRIKVLGIRISMSKVHKAISKHPLSLSDIEKGVKQLQEYKV